MKVFTAGQVAKICKVAPRTVYKWFDSGRLKGYRIPGSADRRIPREYLVKFLKEHGMSTEALTREGRYLIVALTDDDELMMSLGAKLAPSGYMIEIAHSSFDAGILIQQRSPGCLIVDFSIGTEEATQVCRNFQLRSLNTTMILVVLVTDKRQTHSIWQAQPQAVYQKPLSLDEFARSMESLLVDCVPLT